MLSPNSNSHVHPFFAGLLADLVKVPQQARQAQHDAYVHALKAHDWSFEFSDDHAAYERGREQLAQLKLAQRELDPEFTVWNEHAPACCRDGRSYA